MEVIPDGAVEAAREAVGAIFGEPANSRDMAHVMAILEAAAPHMLAAAWDDGHLMGWNEATANTLPERDSLWRNPYRPTP